MGIKLVYRCTNIQSKGPAKLVMINGLWEIGDGLWCGGVDENESPYFDTGQDKHSCYWDRCVRDLCRRRAYRCRHCHPGSVRRGRVDVPLGLDRWIPISPAGCTIGAGFEREI